MACACSLSDGLYYLDNLRTLPILLFYHMAQVLRNQYKYSDTNTP